MIPTHYMDGSPFTACGVPRLSTDLSRALISSPHRFAVTCEDCMSTPAFKASRQRIPEVLGGPYRG